MSGYKDNTQLNSNTPIWVGQFESWESCVDCASDLRPDLKTTSAFESWRWVQRQAAMYQDVKNGKVLRATSLPAFVELIETSNIFDLGGGSGWTIELLSERALSRLNAYVFIEQSEFIEKLKLITSTSEKLEFRTLTDASTKTIQSNSLLYANSALQYLSSDDALSSLIFGNRPNWLLIDDLQTSTGNDFYSLQRYYGSYIPCRFFCLNKLGAYLSKLGYEQIFSFPYPKQYAEGTVPTIEGVTDLVPNMGVPLTVGFRRVSQNIQQDSSK